MRDATNWYGCNGSRPPLRAGATHALPGPPSYLLVCLYPSFRREQVPPKYPLEQFWKSACLRRQAPGYLGPVTGSTPRSSPRYLETRRSYSRAFAGCLQAASLLPRQSLRVVAYRRRPLMTDGEIAVLRLNNCEAPPTGRRRDTWRIRAAEALEETGMDIARANPLTVGLLSFRSVAEHRRPSDRIGAPLSALAAWRPSVIKPFSSLNRTQVRDSSSHNARLLPQNSRYDPSQK